MIQIIQRKKYKYVKYLLMILYNFGFKKGQYYHKTIIEQLHISYFALHRCLLDILKQVWQGLTKDSVNTGADRIFKDCCSE